MPANVESMAYYGEVPWHGLGVAVERGITATEMAIAAGLDWEVDMRPARGALINKKTGKANRYEIVRIPKNQDEEEIVYGIVTKRYAPLQNCDAFQFFDPIVIEGKAYFETAGSLGQGERVWVMAKMPDVMTIVPGDDCMKYLLLSNTHDGKGSVAVKFTSVRVVCQNTLMLAMDDGQKAWRIRHSKKTIEHLNEVAEIITAAQQVFSASEALFKRMASVEMTGDRFSEYLEAVYPKTIKQKEKGTRSEKWEAVSHLFESDETLLIPGVQGTLWAAYNAVTRFEDYKKVGTEASIDDRLARVWYGSSADTKLRALDAAKSVVHTA